MNRLHIHVGGSFADDARRILAAAAHAEAGEAVVRESHISFQDWDTFFRILTPARIELLRYVHAHTVPSVRALSLALGRDYRRVHGDVTALLSAGLIERRGTALATDWDGSDADFELSESA
jgi:predicted transcriptional regulator